MPSPFPGMDPYLEEPGLWSGFHQQFMTYIVAQLVPRLRPKYVPMMETRIEIGTVDIETPQEYYPDVAVAAPPGHAGAGTAPASVTLAAPMEAETEVTWQMTISAVNIHRASDHMLVAVIEVLSPINKRPGNDAYEAYRRKRTVLLNTPVHLIEIDLLRGGRRLPVSPSPHAPYWVVLSRAHRRPRCEVWPITLADPLPTVPVPLLPPDADAPLDLNAVFNAVYDGGGYDLLLDYSVSPPGPLSEAEAAWVSQRLREKALRQ